MKRTTMVAYCFGLCLLLAAPSPLHAQLKSAPESGGSCRTFVQQFYDWYVPIALREGDSESPWAQALRVHGRSFSRALSSSLREEDALQAKLHDAGLGSDPFLNSQDPAQRYVVQSVRNEGDRCWADVYGVYSGHRNSKPDVVAELELINQQWVFTNFLYRNSNLLDLLKSLRQRHTIPKRDEGTQPVRPAKPHS